MIIGLVAIRIEIEEVSIRMKKEVEIKEVKVIEKVEKKNVNSIIMQVKIN